VTSLSRYVQNRQAIDRNPEPLKIRSHDPRGLKHESFRIFERALRSVEARSSRIGTPMRRPEPLHSPSFLVDKDCGPPAEAIMDIIDESANLFGRDDIALEQNDTERRGFTKEAPFGITESDAAAAADKGTNHC
jgi:hypothetical protein